MTRFARAKGSKSSNEKAPEDGTPWEVMKEQLLQSKKENEDIKKRQEAEKQRLENYQCFLNEQKTQKRKATWCEFPDTAKNTDDDQPVKKKKNKKEPTLKETMTDHSNDNSNNNVIDNTLKEIKKKKKKNKNKKELTLKETMTDTLLNYKSNNNFIDNAPEIKKKKKKSKNKTKTDLLQNAAHSVSDVQSNLNQAAKIKEEQKKSKVITINEAEKANESEREKKNVSNVNKVNCKSAKSQKKNKKKIDGKPVRRKEINDQSFQLIINGKEVELVRFDGFPIMKKDAERLQELRNNMIKKGIPKSEVQRTMKLERRRAEKALARLKRDVCYNCRKGGHNLSDCPDLKSKLPGVDAADGVCFKCGSTEHKQFECKVQKNMEFKFATCFICKQAGHIARQCPDNPKGLYPNGGCCKLCGDVTHLRKDCPSVNSKKEETSIKLHTLDSENIEDIVQQNSLTAPQEGIKKPKKITF